MSANSWVCPPCAAGDHTSHDNDGKPWSGRSWDLDAFDCKTLKDPRNQCMCRANWPRGLTIEARRDD